MYRFQILLCDAILNFFAEVNSYENDPFLFDCILRDYWYNNRVNNYNF